MHLRTLLLTGFGTHRDGSHFDFTGEPLTLLHGMNGHGKSWVFDAVLFALYGRHRHGARNHNQIIHDECEAAEVVLTAELGGRLVRITRTAKRRTLESNPDATTLSIKIETAPLDDVEAFVPEEGTSNSKGAAEWLDEHLRFSYRAFTSCAMLIQDEWTALLRATPSERQEIITGLGIEPFEPFEMLAEVLTERVRKAAAITDALQAQIGGRALVSDEQVASAAQEVSTARAALSVAQATAQTTAQSVEGLERLQQLHADLTTSAAALLTEEGMLGDVAAMERAADVAAVAAAALPHAESWLKATDQLATLSPLVTADQLDIAAKREEFLRLRESQAIAMAARTAAEAVAATANDTASQAVAAQIAAQTADVTATAAEGAWRHAAALEAECQTLHGVIVDGARLEQIAQRGPIIARSVTLTQALRTATDDVLNVTRTRDIAQRALQQSSDHTADARRVADAAAAAVPLAQAAHAEAHSTASVLGADVMHARANVTQLTDAHATGTCPICASSLKEGAGADGWKSRHHAATSSLADAERAELAARLHITMATGPALEARAREASASAATLVTTTAAWQQAQQRDKAAEAAWLQCTQRHDSALAELRGIVPTSVIGDATVDVNAIDEWIRSEQAAMDAAQASTAAVLTARALREVRLAELETVRAPAALGTPANRAARRNATTAANQARDRATAHARAAAEALALARRDADEAHTRVTDAKTTGERLREQLLGRERLVAALAAQRDAAAAKLTAHDLERLTTRPEATYDTMRETGDPIRLLALQAQRDRARAAASVVDGLRGRTHTLREQIAGQPSPSAEDLAIAKHRAAEGVAALRVHAEAVALAARTHERLRVSAAETAAIQASLRAAEITMVRLQTLRKRLGKEGLIARLVAQLQADLLGEANDALQRLSSGSLQLEHEAGRSGDEMHIAVRDRDGGGNLRSLEGLSGGQRFRLAVAFAMGISAHMAKHSQATRLDTLMIDEGFGGLDAVGRADMVAELLALRGIIPCIIAVTHQEEVAEHFPVRYHVVRNDGGATATPYRAA